MQRAEYLLEYRFQKGHLNFAVRNGGGPKRYHFRQRQMVNRDRIDGGWRILSLHGSLLTKNACPNPELHHNAVSAKRRNSSLDSLWLIGNNLLCWVASGAMAEKRVLLCWRGALLIAPIKATAFDARCFETPQG